MEVAKIKEIGVVFDGSNENDEKQYPSASGVAEYKSVDFNFEINEQNCMNGSPVENGEEVFVVWIDNGDGFSNPKPSWAAKDDNEDWKLEVEEAISRTKEVISIKADLDALTTQNCQSEVESSYSVSL